MKSENGWGQLEAKPEKQPAAKRPAKPTAAPQRPAAALPEVIGPLLPETRSPKDADEARAWLRSLAEQLRPLSFPTSPITVNLAQYMATAIYEYLASEQREGYRPGPFERALGLAAPGAGRRADTKRHMDIARRVWRYRARGFTNEDIIEDAGITDSMMETWADLATHYRADVYEEAFELRRSGGGDNAAHVKAEAGAIGFAISKRIHDRFARIDGVTYHGEVCKFGICHQTGEKEMTWVCSDPDICPDHSQQ